MTSHSPRKFDIFTAESVAWHMAMMLTTDLEINISYIISPTYVYNVLNKHNKATTRATTSMWSYMRIRRSLAYYSRECPVMRYHLYYFGRYHMLWFTFISNSTVLNVMENVLELGSVSCGTQFIFIYSSWKLYENITACNFNRSFCYFIFIFLQWKLLF